MEARINEFPDREFGPIDEHDEPKKIAVVSFSY